MAINISRIANFAANQRINGFFLATQERIYEQQTQVSTGKVSQDYAGLDNEAERLVNLENTTTQLQKFKDSNDLVDVTFKTMETTLDGIDKSVREFRDALFAYEGGSLTDEQRVKDVQDAAFRALKDLQVHLNTDVGGDFLFGGSRTSTKPVDFGLSNLATFQTTYDGEAVLYPWTRDGHVNTDLTLSTSTVTSIALDATAETVTLVPASAAGSLGVGAKITVSGSATAANNRDYTVVSTNTTTGVVTLSGTATYSSGESVTVVGDVNTNDDTGTTAALTITASNYYSGDRDSNTHRIGENRTVDVDTNAIDPAFDKAIRAMGIIAQGVFGTNGGLDQHPERIDQALNLLSLSLEPPAAVTQPFGTEETSSIDQLEQDLGFDRLILSRANTTYTNLIGFYDQRVADVENVDPLDAITRLLDDQRALEASFQSLTRIRDLSLVRFL
ncbi:MAG: hypothetical protein ACPGOV_10480 [Magnetovibrionaceae bacterium]